MDERRTARVGESIREELLEIIGFEMSDPRVREVDITSVEVSGDGRHAKVRVGVRGADPKSAIDALEHAAGFLRHQLAGRLDLRRMPELHFAADKHPDAESRIELLLKRAGKNRGAA